MVLPWHDIRALRLRGQEGYKIKWIEELSKLRDKYGFLIDYNGDTGYVSYRFGCSFANGTATRLRAAATELGYSFETEYLLGDETIYLGGKKNGIEIGLLMGNKEVTVEFHADIGTEKSVLLNRVVDILGQEKAVGRKEDGYDEEAGEWRQKVSDVFQDAFEYDSYKLEP